MSGLKSLWPSIPFQSEETDMPQVAVPSVPTYNEEVQSMAMRDEAIPMSYTNNVSLFCSLAIKCLEDI